ncbi:glyoxylate reductase [Syncephalis plumigaleata]|nr:glyoxylate reductase [Syncephalis plumigaleata]
MTVLPVRVVAAFPLPDKGQKLLEKYARQYNWELIQDSESMSDERLQEVVASGVDAIICTVWNKIDAALMKSAVGYDHIDVAYAKEHGIQVGHTPDVLTDSCADFTAGLAVAACRRFGEAIKAVKNGQWNAKSVTWMLGMDLRGKTLGVLGMGRIGLATAKRLKAFGMNRGIYHGRAPRPNASEVNGEFVSLDQLLEQSDVLCICCSLNDNTRHMLGYEQFCRMKPTSVVVNIARGGIIEQDEGKISAAGLDATTPEPLPIDHPLLSLDNCIVLPHIACADVDTRNELSILTVNNIIAGVQGKPLPKGL